jgi:hypothetical protein
VGSRVCPELNKRCRSHLRPTIKSYRIDETYIRIKGQDRYLYRAADSTGQLGRQLNANHQSSKVRGGALPAEEVEHGLIEVLVGHGHYRTAEGSPFPIQRTLEDKRYPSLHGRHHIVPSQCHIVLIVGGYRLGDRFEPRTRNFLVGLTLPGGGRFLRDRGGRALLRSKKYPDVITELFGVHPDFFERYQTTDRNGPVQFTDNNGAHDSPGTKCPPL